MMQPSNAYFVYPTICKQGEAQCEQSHSLYYNLVQTMPYLGFTLLQILDWKCTVNNPKWRSHARTNWQRLSRNTIEYFCGRNVQKKMTWTREKRNTRTLLWCSQEFIVVFILWAWLTERFNQRWCSAGYIMQAEEPGAWIDSDFMLFTGQLVIKLQRIREYAILCWRGKGEA